MKTYQVIYFGILLAGIIMAVIRRHKLSKSSLFGAALLFLTFICEATASYTRGQGQNNLWVYHILLPFQFVLVTASFYSELRFRFMNFVSSSFVVFSIGCSLFLQKGQFPSYGITLASMFYIIWVLLFLKALLQQHDAGTVISYPLFWISCGWLVFCLVNLFPFGTFNNYLKGHTEVIKSVFKNIRIGANLILYTCYLIAIVSKQKPFEGNQINAI